MIKSDFSQTMPGHVGNVHFVGIGGAGMSGIAHLFVADGISVSGSDIRDTAAVRALEAEGVSVAIGHAAENVLGADTVVVSGAIAEDNPEYLAARAAGIPVLHRAVALAWLTGKHRLVAVAGAHGKTTSTGMIVTALLRLGADPSFVNGGVLSDLGVSSAAGAGDLFVVEADESDGSFLLYNTAVALVTNVDPDHLDHYGSREAFEDAFVRFASHASELVVISSDDPGAVKITQRLHEARVMTFGTDPGADIRLHSVVSGGTVSFVVTYLGEDYPATLTVPGLHNALNAAGAFGVLVGLGYPPSDALAAVSGFEGTQRRFEFKGEVRGVRVYDDFAHHPTEIAAALAAARGVVGAGRLLPIFQPHLYSRTRLLAAEFARTFETLADHTTVVPIYGARQEPEPGVTGALITDRFDNPDNARYLPEWDDAARHAASVARSGDIVLTMGGGDIYRIVPDVLRALEERAAGRQD